MKEQILRLCKRLNQFTLDEITTITEMKQEEIKPILEELVKTKQILLIGQNYKIIKNQRNTKQYLTLPQMFQYHSNEDIDFIIKGFCSDVEVKKMINLFGLGTYVLNKFYNYFRLRIYDLQKTELLNNFSKCPKIGQEREYLTTRVYLYLYDNKLFVSEKLLKSPKAIKHTESERLMIKNIYLKSYRKVLSRSFAHKFHLHLAEELWKHEKDFKCRYKLIKEMLFT